MSLITEAGGIRRGILWVVCTLGVLGLLAVLVLTGLLLAATAREQDTRAETHPAHGEYVNADDARLFVQRRGNPQAPAVIFVAGTGGWSGLWERSMATAVGLGYQTIAIDLPPFGYSYPVTSGHYAKAAQGRRLLAAIAALHLGQVTIAAHSIGAAPVMEAVFAEPQVIKALILIDPALGLDSPQTDGTDSFLQTLLRIRVVGNSICALLTQPALTEALVKRVISEKEKATPQLVSIYQRPFTLRGYSAAAARWLPEVLASRGTQRSDYLAAYATIRVPVHLIWGVTDAITPLSQGTHLRELIPGATLTQIPRAGHGPQFEEPDLFDAALSAALVGREAP